MFSKVTYLPIFVAFYQAESSRGSVISVSISEEGSNRAFRYIFGSTIASHCHGEIRPKVLIFAHVWSATRSPDETPVTADSKLVVPNGICVPTSSEHIQNFTPKLSPIP
jgi:hypothetical protein